MGSFRLSTVVSPFLSICLAFKKSENPREITFNLVSNPSLSVFLAGSTFLAILGVTFFHVGKSERLVVIGSRAIVIHSLCYIYLPILSGNEVGRGSQARWQEELFSVFWWDCSLCSNETGRVTKLYRFRRPFRQTPFPIVLLSITSKHTLLFVFLRIFGFCNHFINIVMFVAAQDILNKRKDAELVPRNSSSLVENHPDSVRGT